MISKKRFWAYLVVGLMAIYTLWYVWTWFMNVPHKLVHDVYIYGQKELALESEAVLRVMVKKPTSIAASEPVADAGIKVTLGTRPNRHVVYKGITNQDGTVEVRFALPKLAEGEHPLEIAVTSLHGHDSISEKLSLVRREDLLLVTDRPLYQPGQTIHIRALNLHQGTLRPCADREVLLEVEDCKDNKVFKKQVTTSSYGIAAAAFVLADEVNCGIYKISASSGKNKVTNKVTVKKYVLPKFQLTLTTGRGYVLPGGSVSGKVEAHYFFGKPVAGGTVKLTASVTTDGKKDLWKVQKVSEHLSRYYNDAPGGKKELWEVQGKTEENGSFLFAMTLPGQGYLHEFLAQENALLDLTVAVTDKAGHQQVLSKPLPLCTTPIRIAVVPESGELMPGLVNLVYVMASYPDQSPAQAQVTLEFLAPSRRVAAEAKTNALGIATIPLCIATPEITMPLRRWENGDEITTPEKPSCRVAVTMVDAWHGRVKKELWLPAVPLTHALLLRPNKAIYPKGEPIELELFSTLPQPKVWVDILRNRQTILTQNITLERGYGKLVVPAAPELAGTLVCHAYILLENGSLLGNDGLIQSNRTIYVEPTSEVQIHLTASKPVYRPGEEAQLSFRSTDLQGKPVAAALGLSFVDEAVFGLEAMPGVREKTHFTLGQDIREAKYPVAVGIGLPDLVGQQSLDKAQQQAAAVYLAQIAPRRDCSWQRNPQQARLQQMLPQLGAIFLPMQQFWIEYWEDWKKPLCYQYPDGHWGFAPGLLESMEDTIRHWVWFIRDPEIRKNPLQDPFGGKLTMEKLARLDPSFSYEFWGSVATAHKIKYVYRVMNDFFSVRKQRDFKSITLEELVNAGKLAEKDLLDAWGHRLRRTIPDKETCWDYYWAPLGSYVEIRSVGPDGKFGTADDVLPKRPRVIVNEIIHSPRAKEFLVLYLCRTRFRDTGPVMMRLEDAQKELLGLPQPTSASSGPDSAPRLREYFPETLLFVPELLTDAQGQASLNVPLADSITTWRLTVSANTMGGLLGGMTAPLRVFQDFFVDIDFPLTLTQNDEVAVPVAVYNYLPAPQEIRLTATPEPWFELLTAPEQEVSLAAKEIGVVHFRLRASKVGRHKLTVTAYGTHMNDAVRREVEILPNGKLYEAAINGNLEHSVTHEVDIPSDAIPGSSKILLKCCPGIGAALVEGLEGMLRLPCG